MSPKKTVVEEKQQVLVFRLLSSLLPAMAHHQQGSRVYSLAEAQMQSRGEIGGPVQGQACPSHTQEA